MTTHQVKNCRTCAHCEVSSGGMEYDRCARFVTYCNSAMSSERCGLELSKWQPKKQWALWPWLHRIIWGDELQAVMHKFVEGTYIPPANSLPPPPPPTLSQQTRSSPGCCEESKQIHDLDLIQAPKSIKMWQIIFEDRAVLKFNTEEDARKCIKFLSDPPFALKYIAATEGEGL